MSDERVDRENATKGIPRAHMSSEQAKTALCFRPWFEMRLLSNGEIVPCCESNARMGSVREIREQGVASIWNGAAYCDLRRRLVSGDVSGLPCEWCLYRLTHDAARLPVHHCRDGRVRFNCERAEAHFLRGDLMLESMPVSYRMDFTHECNLRCVMCRQSHDRQVPRFPREFLEDFLVQEVYRATAEVVLVGGEPLVVPESVEFLRRLADLGPGECRLTLSTNGQLLDRFWTEIRTFRRAQFAVSLDSCVPATYEAIRRGGRWDHILHNLEEIERTIFQEPERDWSVVLGNVVMKSTLPQLALMLEFGARHGFGNRFGPIMGEENTKENIFLYNWLLGQTTDWQIALQCAIEVAARNQDGAAQANLRGIQKLLQARPFITPKTASLIRRLYGPMALDLVFLDKVIGCFDGKAEKSQCTRLLQDLEATEQKWHENGGESLRIVFQAMLLAFVFAAPFYRRLPSFVRKGLRLRERMGLRSDRLLRQEGGKTK